MSTFGKCEGGGRRCAARAAAPLIAVITTLQRTYSVLIVDVSATGVRLRAEHLPDVGSEMFFSVEKVRAFGTVMWSLSGECGVAFDCALAPKDERLLQEKVALARGLPPDLKFALDNWAVGCGR
jgi:hypothetical protein